MRRIRWEFVNDSAAVAYQHQGRFKNDRVLAFISVVEPELLTGVLAQVSRVLEAYGSVTPEDREAIRAARAEAK